jgi:hypothetical protein
MALSPMPVALRTTRWYPFPMTRERATLGWRKSLVITETLTYDSPVDALVALVRTLMAYEQRYHMGSAEFFAQ